MIFNRGRCEIVDSEEGLKRFQELYDSTPEEIIRDYELSHETLLTCDYKPHIVFVDYDGEIYQSFSLQEGDTIVVCAEERLRDMDLIFNTSGMAFFYFFKQGVKKALFCVTDSPYDLTADDYDNEYFTKASLLEAFRKKIENIEGLQPVTEETVLFVTQL